MKKVNLILVLVFFVTLFMSCKEDIVTPKSPVTAFTISLEFKTLNEGMALVRSLDGDPDQIDSLTKNKLPYVAVFQISTKTDFSDYSWHYDEATYDHSHLLRAYKAHILVDAI